MTVRFSVSMRAFLCVCNCICVFLSVDVFVWLSYVHQYLEPLKTGDLFMQCSLFMASQTSSHERISDSAFL